MGDVWYEYEWVSKISYRLYIISAHVFFEKNYNLSDFLWMMDVCSDFNKCFSFLVEYSAVSPHSALTAN